MSDLITKEKLETYARELCLECPDAPMEECLCGCMKKAIYNALSEALQEREERSKGCEFCNNGNGLEHDGDCDLVKITPLPAINLTTGEIDKNGEPPYWALYITVCEGDIEEYIHITHCPMCGRKLKGAAE